MPTNESRLQVESDTHIKRNNMCPFPVTKVIVTNEKNEY